MILISLYKKDSCESSSHSWLVSRSMRKGRSITWSSGGYWVTSWSKSHSGSRRKSIVWSKHGGT
jgi:hypothetical protein